ncbi:MAG: ABC transporter ATP-binding protein [Desulfobacterales bacterium]|nr:ABC transporter ATP-binding protein [Desulfobacterales bacterium]
MTRTAGDGPPTRERENLLVVEDLKMHFPIRKGLLGRTVGRVHAVDGVSFAIRPGETLGLVGESGCGKTTVGRCVLRLHDPTSGRIVFNGEDVIGMSGSELARFRARAQMIFQDPYSSLNPRLRVRDIIGEALRVHGLCEGDWRDRVRELMEEVGLQADQMARYPHEFSGGQRQRIGIARALAMSPALIVADEPVSALDVSIQAQIINLLGRLKRRYSPSLLIISHDLAVVEFISDRIAVMYLGKLVETASAAALIARPAHPYTRALLRAAPRIRPGGKKRRKKRVLTGDVPSPITPPSGCRFHTRCFLAEKRCRDNEPPLIEIEKDHWAACFKPGA